MKAKRLIEVAMPIKEVSAESVRDKSIRHGHISTLHLWWARRPLPTCRAVVFASLVPDPADPACPPAFLEAMDKLLAGPAYKPYADIPYTAIVDPMEDNPRNRLLMFIGRFSPQCEKNMIAGKNTSPRDQLSNFSLIKWESKNNEEIINTAQELIYVAYNAERQPDATFDSLSVRFEQNKEAIAQAEETLYTLTDRHKETPAVKDAEERLAQAIDTFQSEMPAVFDPFAGGGAIPLEAARLGCRAYGNDLNPVAHIIERASAEFPQRYGKPIIYSRNEFLQRYGKEGLDLLPEDSNSIPFDNDSVMVDNRLSFDVEFYARRILAGARERVGHLYPKDAQGREPIAFYWARTATCSNPSCRAQVPLLKQFYLANTQRKHVWLRPHIHGTDISFTIEQGKYSEKEVPGWNKHGTLTCPCCGSVTDIKDIKAQFCAHTTGERLIAVIAEDEKGKSYRVPTEEEYALMNVAPEIEPMSEMISSGNDRDLKIPKWGVKDWFGLFSPRQLCALQAFLDEFAKVKAQLGTSDYAKALITFLAVWIDRVVLHNTSFGRWHNSREEIENPYSRQAIPMIFDYPESNPFCTRTASATNQLEWLLRYFESECSSSFPAHFFHASSGDKLQFARKSITATVTDLPYYDAIAYADCSDFFYVWLKRTLGDVFPQNFATPQTPKAEECTALKHHHHGSEDEAKAHFEHKLTQIFDAIETQTSDMVAVMFAHQSTQAWTTLLNSILGARMNITGSWPMDTEMANRSIGLAGAALESSVTVACRPVERTGTGSYRKVKRAIEAKVKAEVEKLYALGFRGADLLTACFGQAASEFGNYAQVEKGDGTQVSVADLLALTRDTAYNAFVSGVSQEPLTRFYIGWLYINGTANADHDDITQFTRTGTTIDITTIRHERLIVGDGKQMHLASAQEHLLTSVTEGTRAADPPINQAHRAILLNRAQDRHQLLLLVRDIAPNEESTLWRLLATLKELLPQDNDDRTQVVNLLQNAQTLRQDAKALSDKTPYQTSLFE